MVPYRPQWVDEFEEVGRQIRGLVGAAVLRIDHVGSTAIAGLGAKDVIDIQVTVTDLGDPSGVIGPLHAAGFQRRTGPHFDVFHALPVTDAQLRKQYMREPEGQRRVHIHIREQGRFNQRFALLFHMIYEAASMWARYEGWAPDDDYL